MKELTKEQLAQKIKEHNQEMQLVLVNDLLDKMEHLANKTNRVDYEPSYEEAQKILIIKRYADTILKNIQPLIITNSVTSIGYFAFGFWSANNQPLVIPKNKEKEELEK